MKRTLFVVLVVCLLLVPAQRTSAIDCWDKGVRIRQETSDCRYCVRPDLRQYCIAKYNFEMMDWQGWVAHDNNDHGLLWHADSYLGASFTSAPVPLDGSNSGWCGAGSFAVPVIAWKSYPGYANNWDQYLASDSFVLNAGDNLRLDYMMYVDCEPVNDYMVVELMDMVTGDCTIIDGPHSGTYSAGPSISLVVPAGTYSIRFRFISDCECSDESGCYDSDGGVHIDNIKLTDGFGTLIDYEDFEAAPPGARNVDGNGNSFWWRAGVNKYGSFAGLYANLIDKDPCADNYGTQVGFFDGSAYPSVDYPGLFETPFCLPSGCPPDRCHNEMIISPVINMTMYSAFCNEIQDTPIPPADLPLLGGVNLEFSVYRDLPLSSLVLYYWKIREVDAVGTPKEPWRDRGFLYFGGKGGSHVEDDYLISSHEIGDMLCGEFTYLQVAIGVVDMWQQFFPYGTGLFHSPAPWIDEIKITKYEAEGPRFHYRSIDLFQDNFPDEETGLVRADAAIDIDPIGAATINPRDCIRITCNSPNGGGIAYNPVLPMVYMHVRALDIGSSGMPNIAGPSLVGDCGVYVSDDGLWTIIQAAPQPCACPDWRDDDVFEFDLNDQLFTPGYMVEYYFRAVDNAGNTSYLPEGAPALPNHPGTYYGRSNWFEFTCLPTGDSDILYVDDFHDRLSRDGEVQDNFDDAFMAVLPLEDQPDRYDVNGPSSQVSNSLASRASLEVLLQNYRTIIWDSGNLRNGTICDGTTGDKSLDCQLLHSWLDNSIMEPCLWVLGDNVAFDLSAHAVSGSNLALMNNSCGVQFVGDSYYDIFARPTENPMVGTVAGSIFFPPLDPFCVYGSCPVINAFDYLETWGSGMHSLEYPPVAGVHYYAAIQNQYVNPAGATASTLWFGFSYMYTRGCEVSPQTRFQLVADAMNFFSYPVNPSIVGDDDMPVYSNSLSQNYPNPFNPLTTIDFSLETRGHVDLRIYDVSGRLVKTLVKDVREAGRNQAVWDGRNNAGKAVASGIYFYRMDTERFSETRKMILLR